MPLHESAEDEIRRFEEQFRQQPESLVFARLADAYRKAGDPHRALEVLEEGIRRHADYLSAHIVRARTYRDLGRLEDARTAFERVFEIDPENQVAIRGLAEIAREAEDMAAEIGWLEQLELADPQDPAPGARLEELGRLAEPQHADEQGTDRPSPDEPAAQQEAWWSEESAVESESRTAMDLPADSGLASELWSGPTIIPHQEPEEIPESAPEAEAVEDWEDTAGALTDPLEDLDLDVVAPGGSPAVVPPATEAWWFESPVDPEPAREAAEASDDSESEEDADLLTRTMADLYARQGLIDQAEEIYRELLSDRPDDESLRDGLDAVLGMRAARGASPAPESAPESGVAEVPDSALEPVDSDSPAAVDELTELLRTGEALAHRLPEPPAWPRDTPDFEAQLSEAAGGEAESADDPPEARPVLEEWLRGLRD